MSLVLDALRRVERSTGGPGREGASTVVRRSFLGPGYARLWPLPLGLLVGGILVAGIGEGGGSPPAGPGASPPAPPPSTHARGGAGLPPPPALETARPSAPAAVVKANTRASRVRRPRAAPSPTPLPLVLQAISERDSRRMAVVNDQLVAEGDSLGAAVVIRIDADSVLLGWGDGRRETVRFAPPPASEPTASPAPR